MRLYRPLLHLEIDSLGYHGRSSIHVLSSGPMLLNLFDPTSALFEPNFAPVLVR